MRVVVVQDASIMGKIFWGHTLALREDLKHISPRGGGNKPWLSKPKGLPRRAPGGRIIRCLQLQVDIILVPETRIPPFAEQAHGGVCGGQPAQGPRVNVVAKWALQVSDPAPY